MKNLFSGTLATNGINSQKGHTPGASAADRLAKGLSIAGQDERNVAELSSQLARAQNINNNLSAANSANTKSQSNSVNDNFAAEISKRCETAKKDKPTSAKILAGSLISTANSIQKIFGQDHANAFMSRILAATDSGVDESRLMGAINNT
jgi:hypothetical protein